MTANDHRDFQKLVASYALSTAADAGVGMFLAWVTLDQRGPAAMSWVFVGSAAACLLGPLVGHALDRANARNVLSAACLGRFLVMCVLGGITPETIARFAPLFAFLTTLLNLAHGPCVAKTIPALFSPEEMQKANAASGAAFLIASAAGPALGGVVLEQLGPKSAVALFATLLLVGVPLPQAIRFPFAPVPAGHDEPTQDESTFHLLLRMPLVLMLVVLGVCVNFALAPVNVALAPLMRSLGTGPQGFGLAMGLFVIGALLGNAVAGSRLLSKLPWDQSILACLGGITFALLAVGLSATYFQAAASIFLIGVALPFLQVPVAVQLQRSIPRQRAGRVFSTINSITLLAAPLAAAALGGLLKRFLPAQLFFGAAALGGTLSVSWGLMSRWSLPKSSSPFDDPQIANADSTSIEHMRRPCP